jgi:glutamate-1-semialdehyde 2,1-aminomutase/spore coat polysaccharide biosynthesis protein SpsF
MRSSRIPGKVMADISGQPAIAHVLSRAGRAAAVDDLWLACTEAAEDDPLARLAEDWGARVFRGDETDVLGRFVAVADMTGADVVVRVTGDCPMTDPAVIDRVVGRFHDGDADFVSNTLRRSYPDGLDIEVFSRQALERTHREAVHPFLRAHVTPYMHGRLRDRMPCGDFAIEQVVHDVDFSHLRWTLDEADDLAFLRRLFPRLPEAFGWLDAIATLTREPTLLRINRGHRPYEGTERDLARATGASGQPRRFTESNRFFRRAERVIPLASQTFSKSHRQWVQGAAPLFLESGRGCRVVDIDGNTYIDYVLGLLPVVLGYGDPDVVYAIEEQLDQGIVFSMPHRKETELAERLVRLIPCAEMVRFGKNGSDATSAAVRLARAYTGRDKVALCGYHGWHDWYIGTTSRKLGVPAAVQALSVALPYNDTEPLERLLREAEDQVAALILEPAGAQRPEPGFLERVRAVTERHGVVLIFDEIITGFRIGLGGAQAHYGVTPDLAAFGKAMANGMPVSAVVGRRQIMQLMEEVFFSTTFGGEVVSIAAAIATVDKLEREAVPDRLWRLGGELRDRLNDAADRHGLGGLFSFRGDGWWPRVALTDPPVPAELLNSLVRQEFIANGLFLGASLNLCLSHDSAEVFNETIGSAETSFASIRDALDSSDPAAHLRGEMVKPVFSVR